MIQSCAWGAAFFYKISKRALTNHPNMCYAHADTFAQLGDLGGTQYALFCLSAYEQLETVEQRRSELEYRIAVEERRNTRFTSEMVAFYLHDLQRRDTNDPACRKALIATFINKVYLYDDKLTIHLNTGGDPIEVSSDLMGRIESSDAEAESSFKGASSPCTTKNPNRKGSDFSFDEVRTF